MSRKLLYSARIGHYYHDSDSWGGMQTVNLWCYDTDHLHDRLQEIIDDGWSVKEWCKRRVDAATGEPLGIGMQQNWVKY